MELADKWANASSVIGLLITVVGFALTLFNVARSRTAAERAETAANDAKQQILSHYAAIDLTRVLAELDEIRMLHRAGVWSALPMRYTAMRRQLQAIRENAPTLTKRQRTEIQGVITQFASIEGVVEEALAKNQSPIESTDLNRVAMEQGERLSRVLVALQKVT